MNCDGFYQNKHLFVHKTSSSGIIPMVVAISGESGISVSIWHFLDGYIIEKSDIAVLCNWLPPKLSSASIRANSSPSVDHQSCNDLSLGNGWHSLCCGQELSWSWLLFLISPGRHTWTFRWGENGDRMLNPQHTKLRNLLLAIMRITNIRAPFVGSVISSN